VDDYDDDDDDIEQRSTVYMVAAFVKSSDFAAGRAIKWRHLARHSE